MDIQLTINFDILGKKKKWLCNNPDHTWCPRKPNVITKKMLRLIKLNPGKYEN